MLCSYLSRVVWLTFLDPWKLQQINMYMVMNANGGKCAHFIKKIKTTKRCWRFKRNFGAARLSSGTPWPCGFPSRGQQSCSLWKRLRSTDSIEGNTL